MSVPGKWQVLPAHLGILCGASLLLDVFGVCRSTLTLDESVWSGIRSGLEPSATVMQDSSSLGC